MMLVQSPSLETTCLLLLLLTRLHLLGPSGHFTIFGSRREPLPRHLCPTLASLLAPTAPRSLHFLHAEGAMRDMAGAGVLRADVSREGLTE